MQVEIIIITKGKMIGVGEEESGIGIITSIRAGRDKEGTGIGKSNSCTEEVVKGGDPTANLKRSPEHL